MQGQVVQLAKGVAYQPKASVEDGKLPDHFANYPSVFVHYHAGWSFDMAAHNADTMPNVHALQAWP